MPSASKRAQSRLAAQRAAEARQRRRRRVLVLAGVAVVVAALVISVVWVANRSPTPATPAASGGGGPALDTVTRYPGLSRNHVTGTVAYPQRPPVGGDHAAAWQNCGWYDTVVPNENAVHSLEHAAVWITYSPTLTTDEKARLKAAIGGRPYVLASPFAGLPAPVVASAWGVQEYLSGPDDPQLTRFLATYANSPNAPEPGGECTGGIGNPT